MSPQNIRLWRPVRLTFGRDKGLWEIVIPFLKGTQKILHAPRPRADAVIWKESGSDSPADLIASPLRRQKATGAQPRDIDACGSHLGKLILPWGHWCCCHFGILLVLVSEQNSELSFFKQSGWNLCTDMNNAQRESVQKLESEQTDIFF